MERSLLMGYLSCKAQSAISVSDSHAPSPSSSSSNNIKIQHFDYGDLEAATNGFSDQKLLGKGSHGCVYKASLRGQLVAIKKPSKGLDLATEVDNEIDILSKIQSPRLVNLVGFSNDSKSRILVVEFMSNGTLYDILHSDTRPLNWGRRIRLAQQVAKAIDMLHSQSPPIIHRDIKSANILIDRNFNARLGDFGLALRCHANDGRFLSTPPAGTMGYLDPLYVTPDNLSTKTDVFSFGILLLEVISGRKAIDVGYSPPSIVDWAIPLIKKGKLLCVYDPRISPPKNPTVRKQLAIIAAKCVRSCRERRPVMREIVDWLTGLSELVRLHPWNGFNSPCLVVETVGRPVESRNSQANLQAERDGGGNFDGFESPPGRAAVRKSRRVFSDLGFRSDLMDLMVVNTDQEPEEVQTTKVLKANNAKVSKRVSSLRFVSARYLQKERTRLQPDRLDNNTAVHLRQNHSAGGRSDVVISSSSSQRGG